MRPVCGPGDLRVRKHRGNVLCRTPRVPPLSVCSVEREGGGWGNEKPRVGRPPRVCSLGGAAESPVFLPPTGVGATGRSPPRKVALLVCQARIPPLRLLISRMSTLQPCQKILHENCRIPFSIRSPPPPRVGLKARAPRGRKTKRLSFHRQKPNFPFFGGPRFG